MVNQKGWPMNLCTLSLVYTVLQRCCTNEAIVQPRVSSVPTRSYFRGEQTKSDKQYQADLVGQNSIHVTTSTVLQSVEAGLSKSGRAINAQEGAHQATKPSSRTTPAS